MLSPYESAFLKEISDLPIRKDVRYNAQVAMAETAIVDRLKNIARKAPTGAAIDVFKTYEGSSAC